MIDGLKAEYRTAIIDILAANERVERAVLFGSRAMETFTPASDVDIALFGDRLTLTDQASLAAAIDELPMAQRVDLLLHKTVSNEALRKHIEQYGVEWYRRRAREEIERESVVLVEREERRVGDECQEAKEVNSSPLHIPIGVDSIPVKWRWSRLEDICDGIFDCPHSTPKLSDSGPLMARTQDILSGVFRTDQAVHVLEETYRERTKRAEPTYGDLFYSREGTYFGIAAEVPQDCRVCLGQRMVLIRPNSQSVDFHYLRYWLNSPVMESHIHGFRDGTVAERLNLSTIRILPVLLPPLPEQRAIAHTLGSLDDKIELNRRMNETLEEMARTLFKSWFIDFDPVHAKAALKHHVTNQVPRQGDSARATEAARSRITSPQGGSDWTAERARTHLDNLGQNIADLFPDAVADDGPIGWGQRTLYEIAEFANGAAYKNMHFSPEREGLPVIKIAELKQGVTASTKFTKTELGERYRINTGEILFSWSGNPDTSIDTFIWNDGPAWLNQHIFRVRENGSATRALIYFQLKQLKPVLSEIARNKQTTGLGHITARDMKELMVCDPPKPVVDAFEEIADPMFLRIIANLIENQALARTRDLLLPRLMSGELRMGV